MADELQALKADFDALVGRVKRLEQSTGEQRTALEREMRAGFQGVTARFDGLEAESLLIALDLEGVAVSTGSACSSGSLEPSHVLKAMGLPHPRTRNSLRFSLGPTTTAADIAFVVDRLPGIVEKLRRLTATAVALR